MKIFVFLTNLFKINHQWSVWLFSFWMWLPAFVIISSPFHMTPCLVSWDVMHTPPTVLILWKEMRSLDSTCRASPFSSLLSEHSSSLRRVSLRKYETLKSDDCETLQVWHCGSERTNSALQLFIGWDCLFINLTPGASKMIRLKQWWSSLNRADAASETQLGYE